MRLIVFFIFFFISNVCFYAESKNFKKKLSGLKKQTVAIHNDILKKDDELRNIKIDIEKNSQKKTIFEKHIKDKEVVSRRLFLLLQDKIYTSPINKFIKSLTVQSDDLITKQIVREFFLKEAKTSINQYLESIDGIAQEKASVVEGLKSDGTIIINNDISTIETVKSKILSHNFKPICYGSKDKRNTILNIEEIEDYTKIMSLIEGEQQCFNLNTTANHFASNALGALIVAKIINCDLSRACKSINAWAPGVGRGSIKKINANQIGLIELIDDGYNANPASIFAALNTLGKKKAKRRIAILGDMKELGSSEVDYHKKIASFEAISNLDCIHTVGPLMEYLHSILPEEKRGFHFKNSIDVVPVLDTIVKGGDCLLIKASLSVGMKVIADAISKLEFSE